MSKKLPTWAPNWNLLIAGCFVFFSLVIVGYFAFFVSCDIVVKAAWITGFCTLLAGVFALWGAYLVYLSATRETIRHEKEAESRRESYRLLMLNETQTLLEKLPEKGLFMSNEKIGIPEFFKPCDWENRSMLDKNCVTMINQVYKQLNLWNDGSNVDFIYDTRSSDLEKLLKDLQNLKSELEKIKI
jgi:hypothetical protein